MATTQLECHARGVGHIALTPEPDEEIAIRIAPVTHELPEELRSQLPAGTTWVWAIVQGDRALVGGPAESVTEAAARGEVALKVMTRRQMVAEKVG